MWLKGPYFLCLIFIHFFFFFFFCGGGVGGGVFANLPWRNKSALLSLFPIIFWKWARLDFLVMAGFGTSIMTMSSFGWVGIVTDMFGLGLKPIIDCPILLGGSVMRPRGATILITMENDVIPSVDWYHLKTYHYFLVHPLASPWVLVKPEIFARGVHSSGE